MGIHKDDLQLELNDHPIKKAGSQGQQKTYLVALKFAKFSFMKQVTGKKPILLLDDIFDKFDASRVKQIIQIISGPEFGQIFITDTHRTRLEEILQQLNADHKVFESIMRFLKLKIPRFYQMRRSKTHTIGEVIRSYIQETGLELKLKEVELIESWEEIVGKMVSNRTQKIEIKNGKMIIYLKSSVVRNELMMLRESLKEALNKKAGEELITEIVLK